MYIAYVKTPSRSRITQIHDITDVNIHLRLNEAGSAEFFIKYDNPANSLEGMQEFNRISLYKQDLSGEERLLIEGYIKAPEAEDSGTTIYIGDMNDFLKTKYISSEKNYTSKTLDFIINDLISHIDSRFNTGVTVECGVLDIIPNKEYQAGRDILSILQDIAESGYEFFIENGVLSFKNTVGEDRSISGDNFLQYQFDKDNTGSRSIRNPKTVFNADNIANTIIVKDSGSSSSGNDSASVSKFGSVEKVFSVSGSLNEAKQEILSERKDSVREISFEPESGDFFETGIGDIVPVLINSKNILNDFDGTTKIIEKKFRSGDLNKVDIRVSTSNVKTLSLLEKISKISEKQKLQDL